jgi:hypothetical protein
MVKIGNSRLKEEVTFCFMQDRIIFLVENLMSTPWTP